MKYAWKIVFFSFFIALAGFTLIPRLNVQYLPSGDSQYLRMTYSGYGIPAEQLEREVCVPLESSVASMRGVKEIRSRTRDGSGYVDVELNRFVDMAFFRFDLASRIRQLYPNFPEGVSYPVIEVALDETADQYEEPVLIYSISAPRAVSFLAQYARETISPRVGHLEGVSEVRISGDRDKQIQIDLDPYQMDHHGISVEDLRSIVNHSFEDRAIGLWAQPNRTMLSVRLEGNFRRDSTDILTYLRDLRMPSATTELLKLHDIATVYWKDQEVSSYYRIDGQNALRLLIFPEPGTNHIDLAAGIRSEMAQIQDLLSDEIHVTLEKDNTTFLKDELWKNYQRTGLSLAILLLFVVISYFSWKPVLIIFSGIVVNLGLAFILYYFFRIELNLYAIAGITVTFGIIIDNSIVMIQHVRTQRNRLIIMSLLTATLTTLTALIVIFFLPESLKVQLRYFALVIMINLAVSLLVSLFFIPALMHLLDYDRPSGKSYQLFTWWNRFYAWYLSKTQRRKAWWVTFLVLLFGLPVYLLPTYWSGQDWYNKSIGSNWYRDHGRPVVNKLLGGTSRLFVYYAYEHGGFRDQQETRLQIQCQMPEGSSLEQTNALIAHLENYMHGYLGPVRTFTTSIRGGGQAEMAVFFNKSAGQAFPFILKDQVVIFCSQFGGAQWNVYGVGQGYSNSSQTRPPTFGIQFIGYDRDQLAYYSDIIKAKLERHPRTQDVQTNTSLSWFGGIKNVYAMDLNIQRLHEEGLNMSDFRHIMNYFDIRDNLLYRQPSLPEIEYSMRYPHASRWLMEHKPVWYENRPLDLGSMVSYQKEEIAESIVKVNQEYVQSIKFEYTGSHKFGEQFLDEVIAEMELVLPLGFRMEKKEFSYFQMNDETRSYALLILIIGLMLVILAIHYESFRWPFVIISIIPLSYIGIFLIFYWTGTSFDQGGYTSFILVTGISVNGLIYLMSDYKQLLDRGVSALQAYQMAFEQKILPIFLTIISTVAGLLPFVVIGQKDVFWSSLAVGSIGGLVFSFIVLVLFAPVMLNLKGKG